MPRLFLLLLFVSAPALAQQAPTDTDLRAAYCARILQFDIRLYQSVVGELQGNIVKFGPVRDQGDAKLLDDIKALLNDAQRTLRESRSGLDRINAYLMPKLSYLDPTALLAAAKRADVDLADSQDAPCSQACSKDPKCIERECVQQDIVARFKPCRAITWLPF